LIGLYPLSFGPIVGWYLARGSTPPNAVRTFYAPIERTYKTPFEAPFTIYLYLWIAIYGGRLDFE
jgi:hypothetical protein